MVHSDDVNQGPAAVQLANLSCLRCRRGKRKCDRVLPKCSSRGRGRPPKKRIRQPDRADAWSQATPTDAGPDNEEKLAGDGVDGSGSEKDGSLGDELLGEDEDPEFLLDEAELLFDLSEDGLLAPLTQGPLPSVDVGPTSGRDEPGPAGGTAHVRYANGADTGSQAPWLPVAGGGITWPAADTRPVDFPSRHARVDQHQQHQHVSAQQSEDSTWPSSAGSFDSTESAGGQAPEVPVYSTEVGLTLLRQACSAPVHPYQDAGGQWTSVVGGRAAGPGAPPSVAVYVPRRLAGAPGEDMGVIYHWVCAELANLQLKGEVDPSKAAFVGGALSFIFHLTGGQFACPDYFRLLEHGARQPQGQGKGLELRCGGAHGWKRTATGAEKPSGSRAAAPSTAADASSSRRGGDTGMGPGQRLPSTALVDRLLERQPPHRRDVSWVLELLETPGAAGSCFFLVRPDMRAEEQVRVNPVMEKLFLGVDELMGAAQELSSIMPAVLGRLLNRESMPDFFAATTRSMAPEGTDGNEAGCIVEARNRTGQFMRCLVTMRWSWTSVSAVFGVRFWPLENLMSERPPSYAPQYPAPPPPVGFDPQSQAGGHPWAVAPQHLGPRPSASPWGMKVSEEPPREIRIPILSSGGDWGSGRQEARAPWMSQRHDGPPVHGEQPAQGLNGQVGRGEEFGATGEEEWELCSGGLLDSPRRLGDAVADNGAFVNGKLPEANVGGCSAQTFVDTWQEPVSWNR